MTSSALFRPEDQKFYNTEEENRNNTIVYFNCSAHCNSSDRSCGFRSQGFQLDIPVRTPALYIEICDFQQSVLILANAATKPTPLPSTPFRMYEGESYENLKLHIASGAAIFTLLLHRLVTFLHPTATCRPLFKPSVSLLPTYRQSSCVSNFYRTF